MYSSASEAARFRVVRSVPGADRGPRAGSPRGVVDATGSQLAQRSRLAGPDPVATAPGTDCMLDHETIRSYFLSTLGTQQTTSKHSLLHRGRWTSRNAARLSVGARGRPSGRAREAR